MLPPPLKVLTSFRELHFDDLLVINSFKSIWLNLLGYLFAIGISIPLGVRLGFNSLFQGIV